jgi:hypothetical protein
VVWGLFAEDVLVAGDVVVEGDVLVGGVVVGDVVTGGVVTGGVVTGGVVTGGVVTGGVVVTGVVGTGVIRVVTGGAGSAVPWLLLDDEAGEEQVAELVTAPFVPASTGWLSIGPREDEPYAVLIPPLP